MVLRNEARRDDPGRQHPQDGHRHAVVVLRDGPAEASRGLPMFARYWLMPQWCYGKPQGQLHNQTLLALQLLAAVVLQEESCRDGLIAPAT